MNVIQVNEIVSSLNKQAFGKEAIANTDASFVSIGKQTLSSDSNIDKWFSKLYDRIAKTVLDFELYQPQDLGLYVDPIEFGAIIQMLYIDDYEPSVNESWTDRHQNVNPFEAFDQPAVRQTLYRDMATLEFDGTVPDVQIKSAFVNETAMAAFIEGLMMKMQDSVNTSIETLNSTALSAYIARLIHAGNLMVINPLKLYNDATGNSLTFEKSFFDTEYLRFTSRLIALTSDRFERKNTGFNVDGLNRFVKKENQRLILLSDFAKSLDFYLYADTWHNDLTKIGKFETVPYWQGTGVTGHAVGNVSSINLTVDVSSTDTPDNQTVEESGIMGVLMDRRAVATTFNAPRTKTVRNERKEFTNYFTKLDKGYYNNMTRNGVVFVAKNE